MNFIKIPNYNAYSLVVIFFYTKYGILIVALIFSDNRLFLAHFVFIILVDLMKLVIGLPV